VALVAVAITPLATRVAGAVVVVVCCFSTDTVLLLQLMLLLREEGATVRLTISAATTQELVKSPSWRKIQSLVH
jgi:hypothetical protein